MASVTAPSRAESLAAQWQIWQERLATARQGAPSEDEALFRFATKTEENWGQERGYYLELRQLSRTLGANTLDVRNEGAIDTPQEFAAAMVQLVKRLSDDNYVSLGAKPTARAVESQNSEAIDSVMIEAKPENLRSADEEQALAEAKKLYGPDKDYSNLMRHTFRAQAERFTGEAAVLYVGSQIEADSITSGRGGSVAVLQSLTTRLEELTQDYSRPRSAPLPPADTQ